MCLVASKVGHALMMVFVYRIYSLNTLTDNQSVDIYGYFISKMWECSGFYDMDILAAVHVR